ncbi:MAG: rRNA maturation RNAse YbeY, partial [Alphaproteobacteria bacterium]|nr:rRNA maturation RNAse YbeY [Alphaproteobacteria bacterium]
LLHLFGYDHQTDDEADEMEGIEIQVLQELKISNPYEE